MSRKLEQYMDTYARELFGRTKAEAHRDGICIKCGSSVYFNKDSRLSGAIYTPAGLREYDISGLCEHCFDDLGDYYDKLFVVLRGG